jgi:hypothetical protein
LRFIAKRYESSEANLLNWIKKNGIDKPLQPMVRKAFKEPDPEEIRRMKE